MSKFVFLLPHWNYSLRHKCSLSSVARGALKGHSTNFAHAVQLTHDQIYCWACENCCKNVFYDPWQRFVKSEKTTFSPGLALLLVMFIYSKPCDGNVITELWFVRGKCLESSWIVMKSAFTFSKGEYLQYILYITFVSLVIQLKRLCLNNLYKH